MSAFFHNNDTDRMSPAQRRTIEEMCKGTKLEDHEAWLEFRSEGLELCLDGTFDLEELRLVVKIMEAVNITL